MKREKGQRVNRNLRKKNRKVWVAIIIKGNGKISYHDEDSILMISFDIRL